MHGLPSRIVAGMIATIVVVLLTVGVSIVWMARALDQQALDQSLAQVRTARANLLDQVRLTTLDYAKWSTAVDAVEAGDIDWIAANIGGAANVGQVVQIVAVWGGPLGGDLGWTDDSQIVGRQGLLDSATIAMANRHVDPIPIGAFRGSEFFALQDGAVFAIAATRMEVLDGTRPLRRTEGEIARLAMGRRITADVLGPIEASFLLTDLAVLGEAPADGPWLPLQGADGEPVGYLAWDAGQPGTALLRQMLPILALVMLGGLCWTGLGITLVRRTADTLVSAERQASAAARTDAMTGLPNRMAFHEALARPARAGSRAILFLDVNDFKRINDSIGHEAGDAVIGEIGLRMGRLANGGGQLARISGDEFVFIVEAADAEARAARLAAAIEEALVPPFRVLGHELRLTVAIGFAVQTEDGMPPDSLVRQADLAMYEAKRRKGGPPVAFTAVIEQASRDAARIEMGLRRALDRTDEITLVYQPIIDPAGRLVHAEALARWTSDELGPVSPDLFIRVAEQAGLMVPLGRRLVRLICADLARHPNLRVSINISPLQLMAPGFVPMLTAELREREIRTSRIEIELTEAVVIDDPRLASERLEELHAAGFGTALDDFGTGYASIAYLGQLRFDTLKIDRSFVSQIRGSAAGMEVVRGMIVMAHGLGLRVVCEGVEDQGELELLFALGCDLAQGFHLDRPLPLADLLDRWVVADLDHPAVA